jgi:hypothetical protein
MPKLIVREQSRRVLGRLASTTRERPPVLAQIRFREQEARLRGLALRELFTHVYRTNLWGGSESVSGLGSAPAETARLRIEIPRLLAAVGARSILDIPCGDFGWLSQADLGRVQYIGADIVSELVERNRARFERPGANRQFMDLDLTCDLLPRVDLVLCRDCLVHFSCDNIARAFANLKRSASRHLLTTTFVDQRENRDIADGDWRPLNLQRPPFALPDPLALIVEGCTEEGGAYADKALGLWNVRTLQSS